MHLQTRLTGLCAVLIHAVKHDCVFGVDDLRVDEIELVSQVPAHAFLQYISTLEIFRLGRHSGYSWTSRPSSSEGSSSMLCKCSPSSLS